MNKGEEIKIQTFNICEHGQYVQLSSVVLQKLKYHVDIERHSNLERTLLDLNGGGRRALKTPCHESA